MRARGEESIHIVTQFILTSHLEEGLFDPVHVNVDDIPHYQHNLLPNQCNLLQLKLKYLGNLITHAFITLVECVHSVH